MGLEIMNKIVIARENYSLVDTIGILDILGNNVTLNCQGNNTLYIKNKENLNLHIVLDDNSHVDIFLYSLNKKNNNEVIIEQSNNTTINYYEAFTSKDITNYNIINKIKGNNNKSNIKLRVISKDKNINLNVLANVYDKTIDNDILEDIKGINDGGIITVEPNMEINTNEVMANHLVTIGNITKEYLFYLESKGINENMAKEIILKGFLNGIFKEHIDILTGGEDNA